MFETPETEAPTANGDIRTSGSGTGHPVVDAVLDSLERLEELPVGEHPPIFEQAHDSLRSALTQARENPGTAADRD